MFAKSIKLIIATSITLNNQCALASTAQAATIVHYVDYDKKITENIRKEIQGKTN